MSELVIARYGSITITTKQGALHFVLDGFDCAWPATSKIDVRYEARKEVLRYTLDCMRIAVLWHEGKSLRLWLALKIFAWRWPQEQPKARG